VKRVAFVTEARFPRLTVDDRLAVGPLRERGIRVAAARWDDPGVRWGSFDLVLLRSPWDYYKRAERFSRWLDAREAEGCPLWNPVPLVHWNMDKAYLQDLAAAGCLVVETELLDRGSSADLARLLRRRGWRRAVVKPAVSAAAWRTFTAERSGAAARQPRFERLLDQGDVMVQPFMDEVTAEGEWSFIFIGKDFSHSILKTPKTGDFRSQEEYGSNIRAAEPPASLLAQARRALAACGRETLYARVDGVRRKGKLILMELEVIEPALYLSFDRGAPARLARAVARRL